MDEFKVPEPNLDYHIYLPQMKQNLKQFIDKLVDRYIEDKSKPTKILDVGPSEDEINVSERCYGLPNVEVETLDIIQLTKPDYIGDITKYNECLESNSFDFVVCLEVLEHTKRPWDAPKEIERILKPGGYAFISTPLNFCIHPPTPDNWRFTESGLKELFKEFHCVTIMGLTDKKRMEFPVQYTAIFKKKMPSSKEKDSETSTSNG